MGESQRNRKLIMATAVVTGAGSGVGRAVAIALSQKNFAVALLGRTEKSLKETAGLAHGGKMLPVQCDIADTASVTAAVERIERELGDVDVLVNCAGTNVPRRSFAELSADDFRKLID